MSIHGNKSMTGNEKASRKPFFRGGAGLLASALLLGGCAASPQVRYFTLQGPVAEACVAMLSDPATAARSVQLARLTVPDAVDRPQLVSRSGDNTLNVNEYARWAEPLKSAMAGALAVDLSQALGCAPVLLRSSDQDDTAWSLNVEVRRFEAGAGPVVVLDAWWTLRGHAKGQVFSRRSVLQEPVAGTTLEAMVAAQYRAVGSLARDIARQVKEAAPAN